MKLTTEQVATMTAAMAPLKGKVEALLASNPSAAGKPMRLRWDWAWAAGLGPVFTAWYRNDVNDEHLDTGLRQVVRELGLPQLAA